MSKHSLLLVDGDARSLRVLEVSLRKAGFTVTASMSVQDALDKLDVNPPDLIISEITFPDGDGFELRRRVRAAPDWADIPFVFLTAELALAHKIRGLELGVDDYLTKPIYIKEIVTRIHILLQKRQRARFEERQDGRARFSGRVSDMPVVDVIQTVEISRKSGVIQFVGDRGNHAAIYFRDGKVIDAEAGSLQAEDAVYRLLTWNDGDFEVEFRTVRRREVIATSAQGLLMEGMRRLDEWSRLLEQLPPLWHRFEVDAAELAARLGDVPDDNNRILRLIDGKRTLLEVIDASDVGDLECLQAISRLYFEGMLVDLDHAASNSRPIPRTTLTPFTAPDEPLAEEPIADAAPDAAIDAETSFESANEPEPVPEPAPEPEPEPKPGPLLGGYRPSSLRLIDEAVAAAEAIEPSLFEDKIGAAVASAQVALPSPVEDGGVPHPIEADEPSNRPPPPAASSPVAMREESPLSRDDSAMRMIGSLGRDRASASGELMPPRANEPAGETQRELVTIMPRRTTREVPVVPPPVGTTPLPPPPPLPRTASGRLARPSGTSIAIARDEPRFSEPRDGRRVPRGPGALTFTLLAVAAVLLVIALRMRHNTAAARDALRDAGPATGSAQPVIPPAPLPTPTPTPAPLGDAAVAMPPTVIDAGVTLAVAPDAAPADAGPAVDAHQRASMYLEQAYTALNKDEPDRALALVTASLRQRGTARGFVLRATIQRKLGHIDAALDDLGVALDIVDTYTPALLLRGEILMAAHRTTEGRATLQRFLDLAPNSPDAATVRGLLSNPP